MSKLNSDDVEYLAICAAKGISLEEAEELSCSDDFDIYEFVIEHYDCDFETFSRIAEDLIKLTPPVISPLTGEYFHAFMSGDISIAKKRVE